MIRSIRIKATECTCQLCQHRWVSISKRLPACCPNRKCRSREWNGKKVQRRPEPGIKLPKPTKVRNLDDEGD